jgi:23S rRNA (guanosine2251-2'-O)-methyltransferase
VEEALQSGSVRVHEILLAGGEPAFVEGARARRIPVRASSREGIGRLTGTDKHQNVAARVTLSLLESAKEAWNEIGLDRTVTVLAADGVQDPQNLGSLLRSAHFFGADFFLITKDRSAPLSGAVAKASAGAIFSLPIVRATNLARELEWLGEQGVFRVALDGEGAQSLRSVDLRGGSLALVVGGEGQGIRELTKKRCDVVAKLTDVGFRDSLNAAIAGAVALYEATVQRPKR